MKSLFVFASVFLLLVVTCGVLYLEVSGADFPSFSSSGFDTQEIPVYIFYFK